MMLRTQEQYPECAATNREDKPALIQVSCAEQPHRARPESFIVLTLLHKWKYIVCILEIMKKTQF